MVQFLENIVLYSNLEPEQRIAMKNQMSLIKLLTFSMILNFFVIQNAHSQSARWNEVPWDTVIARTKVILYLNQPDSIKGSLLRELFQKYRITLDDYREAYHRLQNSAIPEQISFLKRVKEITEGWLKKPRKLSATSAQQKVKPPPRAP
ncbi:MAG: hypothetical protein D6748_06290 [Calditrichaeota bacterium]|nr:MAG: hypothetical protein D6748_06290 [Calditrichota bacterium]